MVSEDDDVLGSQVAVVQLLLMEELGDFEDLEGYGCDLAGVQFEPLNDQFVERVSDPVLVEDVEVLLVLVEREESEKRGVLLGHQDVDLVL